MLLLGATGARAFTWSPDMKRSLAKKPERFLRMPPDSTVPLTGKLDARMMRDQADKLVNPVTRSAESDVRGKKVFEQFCVPCHGGAAIGNGPVSKFFPGVANLTADLTKGRSDGFIYFYVRHGGVLMPSYGYGVKPAEAWDVVNYVRKLQGK
jgi:mono/diheme cytochrome c family protein